MKHNWEELYVSFGDTPSDIDETRIFRGSRVATMDTEKDIERCKACGTIRITKMNGTHIYFKPGWAGQDRRYSPIWMEPKCVEE